MTVPSAPVNARSVGRARRRSHRRCASSTCRSGARCSLSRSKRLSRIAVTASRSDIDRDTCAARAAADRPCLRARRRRTRDRRRDRDAAVGGGKRRRPGSTTSMRRSPRTVSTRSAPARRPARAPPGPASKYCRGDSPRSRSVDRPARVVDPNGRALAHPSPRSRRRRVVLGLVPAFVEAELDGAGGCRLNCSIATGGAAPPPGMSAAP